MEDPGFPSSIQHNFTEYYYVIPTEVSTVDGDGKGIPTSPRREQVEEVPQCTVRGDGVRLAGY